MSKVKFLFAVAIVFIIGCSDSKKAEEAPSVNEVLSNPEVGKVNEDSLYVRLFDEGLYPYYSSIAGDFNRRCEIKSEDSGKNIDCIIDVNELDLYFNGIKLQSNFPSSMCEYVYMSPYWHYNFEIGYGPRIVEMTVTKDADNKVTGTSCKIDGVVGCNGSEASFTGSDESVECIYDKSKGNGVNCCLGSYTKTVTTITPKETTTTQKTEKWGGDLSSCIGGPGKMDWKLFSKEGYPVGEVSNIKNKGLNSVFKVTAPLVNANSGQTLTLANYYKPFNIAASANHRHTGYVITRTTDLPYMIDPIDDRSGSALYRANPAYTWQCLDKNREVINQVKVYVREWNTYSEFIKYGTSQGAEGNPDIGGVEGTDCNHQASGNECDDYYDHDEYKGPFSILNRYLYFPNVEYTK